LIVAPLWLPLSSSQSLQLIDCCVVFINIRWGKAPKDEGSGCIPDRRTHLWIRHSLSIYCNDNVSEVNSDIVCGTVLGEVAHDGTLAVPAPRSLTSPRWDASCPSASWQNLVGAGVLFQKVKGHFFLRDRHTKFYAYYKREQFDSMVSVRASIRRPY
jgi:hypothetical protein